MDNKVTPTLTKILIRLGVDIGKMKKQKNLSDKMNELQDIYYELSKIRDALKVMYDE